MKKLINEKKFQRAGLLEEAEKALAASNKEVYEEKMNQVKSLNATIDDMEKIEIERGRFDSDDIDLVSKSQIVQNMKQEEETDSNLTAARGEKEYARAFAYAVKNGLNQKTGKGNETLKPLYSALTIGGGTPEGSDGGFLVPIDIDNSIRELRRHLPSLADLVSVETVSSNSGWRVKDTAPTKGFTKLSGELTAIPEDDQPKFGKVDFKLDPYALFIPISNELAEDEDASLFAYLARWFAKKMVITENKLVLEALALLTAKDLASGTELAGVKTALNKTLDPANSAMARFIMNQSAFDTLDQLMDTNKRPLLQPNPIDETAFRLKGRDITLVSDAMLANTTTKSPIYVGDFEQYMTLFRRKALEVSSTNIGGNAWRNNGIEIRGVARYDAAVFDSAAAAALTVTAPVV